MADTSRSTPKPLDVLTPKQLADKLVAEINMAQKVEPVDVPKHPEINIDLNVWDVLKLFVWHTFLNKTRKAMEGEDVLTPFLLRDPRLYVIPGIVVLLAIMAIVLASC